MTHDLTMRPHARMASWAKRLGCVIATAATFAGAFPQALANEIPHPDVAIVFVGGFQTKQENYTHYFEHLKEIVGEVRFFEVNQSMFKPDHLADYAGADQKTTELAAAGFQKIVAMGFSAGGKHAARLAIRRPEVKGVILLDPVDGGPDPKGKTPIFLTGGEMVTKPTALVRSEFGHVPKIFNRACAPEDVGHTHFRKHIGQEHLVADETIAGTGHLNFIAKPWNPMFAMLCDNGNADAETASHAIFKIIDDFLDTLP